MKKLFIVFLFIVLISVPIVYAQDYEEDLEEYNLLDVWRARWSSAISPLFEPTGGITINIRKRLPYWKKKMEEPKKVETKPTPTKKPGVPPTIEPEEKVLTVVTPEKIWARAGWSTGWLGRDDLTTVAKKGGRIRVACNKRSYVNPTDFTFDVGKYLSKITFEAGLRGSYKNAYATISCVNPSSKKNIATIVKSTRKSGFRPWPYYKVSEYSFDVPKKCVVKGKVTIRITRTGSNCIDVDYIRLKTEKGKAEPKKEEKPPLTASNLILEPYPKLGDIVDISVTITMKENLDSSKVYDPDAPKIVGISDEIPDEIQTGIAPNIVDLTVAFYEGDITGDYILIGEDKIGISYQESKTAKVEWDTSNAPESYKQKLHDRKPVIRNIFVVIDPEHAVLKKSIPFYVGNVETKPPEGYDFSHLPVLSSADIEPLIFESPERRRGGTQRETWVVIVQPNNFPEDVELNKAYYGNYDSQKGPWAYDMFRYYYNIPADHILFLIEDKDVIDSWIKSSIPLFSDIPHTESIVVDSGASVSDVYGALDWLEENSGREDKVIWVSATHGSEDGELCFSDGRISADSFASELSEIKADEMIVLISACHSGQYFWPIENAVKDGGNVNRLLTWVITRPDEEGHAGNWNFWIPKKGIYGSPQSQSLFENLVIGLTRMEFKVERLTMDPSIHHRVGHYSDGSVVNLRWVIPTDINPMDPSISLQKAIDNNPVAIFPQDLQSKGVSYIDNPTGSCFKLGGHLGVNDAHIVTGDWETKSLWCEDVIDDFEVDDWKYETSGDCNSNDHKWDNNMVHSGGRSYYLKAGCDGCSEAKDCKAFITKTFDVGNYIHRAKLCFWYRSEQAASDKRYFNIYLNGEKIRSKNNIASGEWKEYCNVIPYTFESGKDISSPVTVKLEWQFDGAWSASASGWFDDVKFDYGEKPSKDVDGEIHSKNIDGGFRSQTDQDFFFNDLYVDTDGDGLIDYDEIYHYKFKTNPSKKDSDDDGIDDKEEIEYPSYEGKRLDPNNNDTDGDWLKDGEEVKRYNTNPLETDTDGDKLSDYEEIIEHNTDPNKKDTDSDGLNDRQEVNDQGTDPNNPDTDGDGLTDGQEVFGYRGSHTNPNNPDTDGDSYTDKVEIDAHSDPNDPNSIPTGTEEPEPECEDNLDCSRHFECVNGECVEFEPLDNDIDGDGVDNEYDCYPNEYSMPACPHLQCCKKNRRYTWQENCDAYGGEYIPFEPVGDFDEYYENFGNTKCSWVSCQTKCRDICINKAGTGCSGRQDGRNCGCYRT